MTQQAKKKKQLVSKQKEISPKSELLAENPTQNTNEVINEYYVVSRDPISNEEDPSTCDHAINRLKCEYPSSAGVVEVCTKLKSLILRCSDN